MNARSGLYPQNSYGTGRRKRYSTLVQNRGLEQNNRGPHIDCRRHVPKLHTLVNTVTKLSEPVDRALTSSRTFIIIPRPRDLRRQSRILVFCAAIFVTFAHIAPVRGPPLGGKRWTYTPSATYLRKPYGFSVSQGLPWLRCSYVFTLQHERDRPLREASAEPSGAGTDAGAVLCTPGSVTCEDRPLREASAEPSGAGTDAGAVLCTPGSVSCEDRPSRAGTTSFEWLCLLPEQAFQ